MLGNHRHLIVLLIRGGGDRYGSLVEVLLISPPLTRRVILKVYLLALVVTLVLLLNVSTFASTRTLEASRRCG